MLPSCLTSVLQEGGREGGREGGGEGERREEGEREGESEEREGKWESALFFLHACLTLRKNTPNMLCMYMCICAGSMAVRV